MAYAMSARDKDLLRSNSVRLSEALGPNIEHIVAFLQDKKVISRTMKEDILYTAPTPTKKAYKLLDLLPSRGPTAVPVLLSAALKYELWDAADILEPGKAPHDPELQANDIQFTVEESPTNVKRLFVGVEQPSAGIPQSSARFVPQPGGAAMDVTDFQKKDDDDDDDDKEEPLPDVWPSQDHMDTVRDLKLKVKTVQENQKKINEKFRHPDKNNVYDMDRKYKGRALIINNYEFTNGLLDRVGYQQDKKALERVFQDLQFDNPIVECNKKAADMLEMLKLACNFDYHFYSCFVLIIISHGKKGKVFGTDGVSNIDGEVKNYIEIDTIKDMFCRSESLQSKPKLIFIEACQTQVVSSNPQTNGVPYDIVTPVNDFTPRDLYLVLATCEGFKSRGNEEFGSWFIQALCYVVANYAYKDELCELMRKISRLLKKERVYQQVPQPTAIMDKTFYFFPGLPRDS